MNLSENVNMDRLQSDLQPTDDIHNRTTGPSTTSKDCVYTFSDNGDSDDGEQLKYKIKNIIQSPAKDGSQCNTSQDGENDDTDANEEADANGGAEGELANSVAEPFDCLSPASVLNPGNFNQLPHEVPPNDNAPTYQLPEAAPGPEVSALVPHTPSYPHTLPGRPRRVIPNGITPKSGKPLTFANVEKKAARIRSKPKRKEPVTTYQSQISDNKMGIKLKLKKSETFVAATPAPAKAAATKGPKSKKSIKSNRKRTRRGKARHTSDDDSASDEETRSPEKRRRARVNAVNNNSEPEEQTAWGALLPHPVLVQIFTEAVKQDGSLPTLDRVSRVCSLWREAALTRSLWRSLDLARWTKEKHRTEWHLKWFIETRLSAACTDLNLSNWKITNVNCVLSLLAETCPNLEAITLSGWKEFSSDDLIYLAENFTALRRLDMSAITMELNPGKSSVGLQAMCTAIQMIGSRLTHLYLAHNRLAGIPQIANALAAFSPNLVLLDLSNVSTVAISHGILPLEKIQTGCPRLKVLRITNSHITLGSASLQEQMDSPGFPDLEELSIASTSTESRLINDDYLQRILKTSTKLQLLDVRGSARLTHQSLIRLPTWDLKHLFLSGCLVTRDIGSGLELIASKWAHSLIEFDLAWANVQATVDSAIRAIAEKGDESPLNHLNLTGSSVSVEAVQEILKHCPYLTSINLSSCRGLPRGCKRLMQGANDLRELRENLGVIPKFPVSSAVAATTTAPSASTNSTITSPATVDAT